MFTSTRDWPYRVRRPISVAIGSLFLLFVMLLAKQANGQVPGDRERVEKSHAEKHRAEKQRAANQRTAQSLRREWVRSQITKLVPDKRARAEILEQINRLPDDQIQEIAVLCLDELEARKQQQFAILQAANARERAARAEAARVAAARRPPAPLVSYPYGYPAPLFLPRPIGFVPIITWLPEGASLSAQAVVTPDGRHVRMSLAPFFSTIGPVDTFNFMTGETRRYDP